MKILIIVFIVIAIITSISSVGYVVADIVREKKASKPDDDGREESIQEKND